MTEIPRIKAGDKVRVRNDQRFALLNLVDFWWGKTLYLVAADGLDVPLFVPKQTFIANRSKPTYLSDRPPTGKVEIRANALKMVLETTFSVLGSAMPLSTFYPRHR